MHALQKTSPGTLLFINIYFFKPATVTISFISMRQYFAGTGQIERQNTKNGTADRFVGADQ
jgi:hypothetical protein